jgi:hypothetical protein
VHEKNPSIVEAQAHGTGSEQALLQASCAGAANLTSVWPQYDKRADEPLCYG